MFRLCISGLVHKLGNHNEEFGITDSLACCEGLLLASAFCLDKGLGYINGNKQLSKIYDDHEFLHR